MKPLTVLLFLFGLIFLYISVRQGLAFGTTAEGPLVQGYVGGLLPTVTAVAGCVFFYRGIKTMR